MTADAPGARPGVTRGTVVIDVERLQGMRPLHRRLSSRGARDDRAETVNGRGYRFPLLLEGCTGCAACSPVCPDFVFQVYKYDTPLDVSAGVR